jgi:hypothetical protein
MNSKVNQKIDTNLDNYTLVDLLTILDIDVPTVENVTETTERYIKQFEKEKNETMVFFFTDMRDVLLVYVDGLKSSKDAQLAQERAQTELWWSSQQVLPQPEEIQKDKITERRNNTETYNSDHAPMNKKQLGVANVKSVDVAQDTLNPNLTNTTNRIICLDSQYRQVSGVNSVSTDYTLDLTEPLVNVLSLRPYSFQVPYNWYTINTQNSCFFLTFYESEQAVLSLTISIESGNYTSTTLVAAVTTSLKNAGITFPDTEEPITYNSTTGKLTLFLYGGEYIETSDDGSETILTIDDTTIITYYDPTNELSCFNGACDHTHIINETLGWLMGFRVPYENVTTFGNLALGVLNLIGPKYLIVVLDDFNQNHINSGLIGIGELSKTLKLPSYYSPDLPYVCVPAKPVGTNLESITELVAQDKNAGRLIMDKWDATYASRAKVLPSAPRILTQSQIYSINEIMKNNERYSNYTKLSSPSCTDTFAVIPLDKKNLAVGDLYVEDSSTLQLNKRIYFGPVNIERFRVKLVDDRGGVLNLNGGDWCLTLIAEVLYQY